MTLEYFIHKEDFGTVNFTLHKPTNITASKWTDFCGRFEIHLHSIRLHRKILKFVHVVFIEVIILNKKSISAFNLILCILYNIKYLFLVLSFLWRFKRLLFILQ